MGMRSGRKNKNRIMENKLIEPREDRSTYSLVGTIRRYSGSMSKALDWMDHLPVKYPNYALAGMEEGDYYCWTKEEGLFIIKKGKNE